MVDLAFQVDPQAWLHEVCEGLKWVQHVTVSLHDLPDPSQNLAPWERHARRSLPAWRKQLKHALEAHAAAASRLAMAVEAEQMFFQMVKQCGVPLPIIHPDHPLRKQAVEAKACARCPWCKQGIDIHKALQQHIVQNHYAFVRHVEFIIGPSSTCRACAKEFKQRRQVRDHLAFDSIRCPPRICCTGPSPHGTSLKSGHVKTRPRLSESVAQGLAAGEQTTQPPHTFLLRAHLGLELGLHGV